MWSLVPSCVETSSLVCMSWNTGSKQMPNVSRIVWIAAVETFRTEPLRWSIGWGRRYSNVAFRLHCCTCDWRNDHELQEWFSLGRDRKEQVQCSDGESTSMSRHKIAFRYCNWITDQWQSVVPDASLNHKTHNQQAVIHRSCTHRIVMKSVLIVWHRAIIMNRHLSFPSMTKDASIWRKNLTSA